MIHQSGSIQRVVFKVYRDPSAKLSTILGYSRSQVKHSDRGHRPNVAAGLSVEGLSERV